MFRVLVAIALLVGTARADIRECHVFNNTDHDVGGGHPGQSWWIAPGAMKYRDGDQVIELTCDAKTPVQKLVGKRGRVTIERLPAWFGLSVDSEKATITVKSTKQGTTVAVAGNTFALKNGTGTQVIDTRAMLLAADPDVTYENEPVRRWHVDLPVKASAGDDTVELLVAVEASLVGKALVADLHAAETKPVAWAAAPDRAGPAVFLGCGFPELVSERRATSLSAISLVVLCERKDMRIESCPSEVKPTWNDPERPDRFRADIAIRAVEARTGTLVGTTTLHGGEPAACHAHGVHAIRGEDVSKGAVLGWLESLH